MIKTQKLKFTCLAIFISIILVIMSMAWLSVFSTRVKAEENAVDFTRFTPVEVKIDNNQFGSFSGSPLQTPDSWTGGGVNGSGAGNTVTSVINLPTFSSNAINYKLEADYPDEFSGSQVPESPFNESTHTGGNKNVLMINVRPGATSGTAYGFTSSAMTFDANKFYRVSAFVRTGNFNAGSGAAIRLNGLSDDVSFNKINTVNLLEKVNGITQFNSANKFGWKEYVFYVAAPSVGSKTVTISLQVGDSYTSEDGKVAYQNYTTGYSYFDNISAEEIDPEMFYSKKDTNTSDQVIVKDYSDISNFTPSSNSGYSDPALNYGFASTTNDMPDNWDAISAKSSDLSALKYGVVDITKFDKVNNYNIKENPSSSLLKLAEDPNILVLSSFNSASKQYVNTASGVRSTEFQIQRYKYYRVSAWVKTQDVEGGNGANLAFYSTRVERPENDKEQNAKDDISSKILNATGDTANLSRGGFKLYSFYVKGSALSDYSANLQMWLGSEGAASKGIAMFDNMSVKEITPLDFSTNSASGTVVNMDTEAGIVDAAPATNETGITNGNFLNIGDYTEFKFPMPAKDWTSYTVETVGTTNYSTNATFVKTKNVISGIVPTDEAHFEANKSNYGIAQASPAPYTVGSMLMISSSTPTAYAYRSANFTVAAPVANEETGATTAQMGKLQVKLHTQNIQGYGANLVLKQGNNIIGSIERIKNTMPRIAETFTFYIEQGKVDVSDLSVEIWLGLNDRTDNNSKQTSGTIFVEQVSFAMVADEFAAKNTAYEASRSNNTLANTKMATYSFKSESLNAFDSYDSNFVKYPYNYTATIAGTDKHNVIYGIFDPALIGSQSIVPKSFKNSADAANKNVIMLKNSVAAATSLSLNTKYNLTADTYYKITVRAKVDIPEQTSTSAGAFIKLSDTDFGFNNITKTLEVYDQNIDNEVFQNFTFFVKVGSEARSVGISIGLGDSKSSARHTRGTIYVNEITFTDITNVLYEENTSTENLEKHPYWLKAELSATTTETPEETKPKSEFSWLVIPSILFGIAILAAIIGFCIRRIMDRRSDKVKYEKSVSYDRSATLNKDFNNAVTSNDDKIADATPRPASDNTYDTFSDDVAAKVTAKKVAKTTATEQTEAPQQTQPINTIKDAYTDMFDDDAPAQRNQPQKPDTAEDTTTVQTSEDATESATESEIKSEETPETEAKSEEKPE